MRGVKRFGSGNKRALKTSPLLGLVLEPKGGLEGGLRTALEVVLLDGVRLSHLL